MSFIMTRTSTEDKLRWHESAPHFGGRLGGPVNSYILLSVDNAFHGSDTFQHANFSSNTMHGAFSGHPR